VAALKERARSEQPAGQLTDFSATDEAAFSALYAKNYAGEESKLRDNCQRQNALLESISRLAAALSGAATPRVAACQSLTRACVLFGEVIDNEKEGIVFYTDLQALLMRLLRFCLFFLSSFLFLISRSGRRRTLRMRGRRSAATWRQTTEQALLLLLPTRLRWATAPITTTTTTTTTAATRPLRPPTPPTPPRPRLRPTTPTATTEQNDKGLCLIVSCAERRCTSRCARQEWDRVETRRGGKRAYVAWRPPMRNRPPRSDGCAPAARVAPGSNRCNCRLLQRCCFLFFSFSARL
jgi:hypothetical protein